MIFNILISFCFPTYYSLNRLKFIPYVLTYGYSSYKLNKQNHIKK